MNRHPILALVAPLLVLACDKDKREKPSPDDTAPTHDTGPDTEPGCDTGQLEDDGECVPAACGAGTWGNLEVDENTVFVDIAAAEGGDGSQAAPFTSLQAGLDAAGDADGGTVAVAAGTYPETLALDRGHDGVRLAGRCRELVGIDASAGDEGTPGIFVDAKSSEAEISGVTVSGSRLVGVAVGSGAVTMRDSAVVGSEYIGVGAYQEGMNATALTMEGCEVVGNTTLGVGARDSGTSVTLRETVIEDSQPDENGEAGYGIQIYGGASLDAEACEVRGNSIAGVLVAEEGTTVTLRETVIEDTQPGEDGERGYGIEVQGGASLAAEGCEIRGNTSMGVLAAQSGTTVSLQATTIEDTQRRESGEGGYGICAGDGASLDAEACQVRNNAVVGVEAFDSGTVVRLRDTVIEDTQPDGSGAGGYGVEVWGGARLEAEACQIVRNSTLGVTAYDSGSAVTLLETAIEHTQPNKFGAGGYGAQVSSGASLDAVGCVVRGNTGIGVGASDSGTSVSLRESSIEQTRPLRGGLGGYGIQLHYGVTLDVEACEVLGNTGAGVIAFNPGTAVNIKDTRIASTMRGEVLTVGIGVAAGESATVMATGIEVSMNEGPGIYVAGQGAQFACLACDIQDNRYAGAVAVWEATLELDESLIEGTTEQENLGGGVGIFAHPWDGGPPSLSVADSTIRDNAIAGVWLSGAGSYSLADSTIHGGEGWTRGGLGKCGDAVFAQDGVTSWDGASGLLLQDNELLDGLGAGLFLDDASATLSGNSYADNAVDIVTQGADCAVPPDGYQDETIGSAELCPSFDYATCGDEFALVLTLAEPDSGQGGAFAGPPLSAMPAMLPLALVALPLLPAAQRPEPPAPHPLRRGRAQLLPPVGP